MGKWVCFFVLAGFLLLSVTGPSAEAAGLGGVGIRPIYADDKLRLNLPDTSGCVVVAVQKGSEGDLMGIRLGDVIRSFNGAPVLNVPSFIQQVKQAPTVQTIGVWRDGQAQNLVGQGTGSGASAAALGQAASERAQPLEGFLGMSWSTAPAATRQLIQERGGYVFVSAGGSEKEVLTHLYKGTFAGRPADVTLSFSGGQFFQGIVFLKSPVDDILTNYDAMGREISEKYGPVNRRTGRYLDSKSTWLFPVGQEAPNSIVMDIVRLSAAGPPSFSIRIEYTYGVIRKTLEDKKNMNTKKDL